MIIGSLRRRATRALVTAAAATATVLAPAVPAGASTGPRYTSAEQVGYAATGAQFELVRASVYLRQPAQYTGAVGHYSQSVQLWSPELVMVLGAAASTSGSSYTPYAKVYDARSHLLLAPNPDAEWCAQGDCDQAIGRFPAGDTVTFTVKYYHPGPDLIFIAQDITPGADYGMYFWASYSLGKAESFTQARVGTEFGSNPWTAPRSYAHPAQWTKIAAYSHVRLATYNGRFWTLASWFAHHKIFMAANTGSQIDVQAAPTNLSDGGGSFQDWLAPAGVNSPAPPPRG
jgi:hypothetical protein